jgi:H/ACA ribonucleoprotein complex subunit 4
MIYGALIVVAESGIEHHEEVVLMTTKGEAIALGIAQMSTVEMSTCDHGVVAKVKRCIMERDLYPRRWGLGPVALEKKKLKADGKLDKFGRPNEATPSKWTSGYQDYGAAAQAATDGAPAARSEPEAMVVEPAAEAPTPAEKADGAGEQKDTKRKKKHEGETAEEKAERKRRKKEKKEKRKSAGGKDEDEDSD